MNVERRQLIYVLVFSLAVVAIAYVNSLPNDMFLDDYFLIGVNPDIHKIAPIHNLLTPFWGDKSRLGIYRPLVPLSFSLEYPFWHRWPGGYRSVNFAIHAINGVLVYALARGFFLSPAASWAASAVFLLHPVHTEAVAGVAGRSDLLAGLFFFLGWLSFRSRQHVLAAVAFLLAMLSKETAIMLPAVLLLETWMADRSLKKTILQWKRFVPLAVSGAVYLLLRGWVLGGLGMPKSAEYLNGNWTFFQREFTSGRAFLKYFQLLLAPVRVTGDYDFNSIPLANARALDAWVGILLIVASIVFAVKIAKRVPAVSFAILFFYIALFPVSNWILPAGLVMAERYLYVPMFGFALIAGLMWSKIPTAERRGIVAVGVLGISVLLCISHNFIWRGSLSYHENLVNVFPDNVRGRHSYGMALLEVGHPDMALEQFEAGLKVARDPALLTGLASARIQLDHNCVAAKPTLAEAIKMSADYYARWTLARCYEKEGDLNQGEATYRQAIADAAFPDPNLLADWGRTLKKLGRDAEAQQAFDRGAALLK